MPFQSQKTNHSRAVQTQRKQDELVGEFSRSNMYALIHSGHHRLTFFGLQYFVRLIKPLILLCNTDHVYSTIF